LFRHELRSQLRLYGRSRELAFFTFALPLIMFFLLGSVYGNDRIKAEGNVRAADYLLAGMLGYGAIATGFAGLSIMLVIRRESGILKRVRATPLPAWAYVVALLCTTLIAFALEAVCMSAIGRIFFHTHVHNLFSLALALLRGPPFSLGTARRLGFASLGNYGFSMGTEPQLAFYHRLPEPPGLEVRVNFGIFAGRAATAAEIDELAQALLTKVGEISIVAEDRHEIGEDSEALLHQVRIDVDPEYIPADEHEA